MTDLTTGMGGLRLRNLVIAACCEHTMAGVGILVYVDAGAGAVITSSESINQSPATATQLDIPASALLGDDVAPVSWEWATGTETRLNRTGLVRLRRRNGQRDQWAPLICTLPLHRVEVVAQQQEIFTQYEGTS